MKYSLLLLCIFTLSSCGINDDQKTVYVPPRTVFESSGETLTGGVMMSIPDKTVKKVYSRETIGSIRTLDDLVEFNPMLADAPKKDHPKFVELQKDRMLLALSIGRITDPEYLELQSRQSYILLAKEIWTPELQKVDKELTDLIVQTSSTGITSQKISDTLAKKNQLMQEFHLTAACIKYTKAHKSELDTLTESMKKFLSPEIIQLQQDIEKLNAEIYNPSQI